MRLSTGGLALCGLSVLFCVGCRALWSADPWPDAGNAGAAAPQPHEPPVYDPEQRVQRADVLAEQMQFAGGPNGFLGIVSTGWNPPDPHMAVGPNHIVMMTNGAIAFFEKDGTETFTDQIEGAGGFWGALGTRNFVFDPEVIYDPQSQRFFAMANERSNNDPFYLLAVSDDSDPNGLWHKYRFYVENEINDWDIDSPNISVDDTTVYLTSDFFGGDKYLIYMVDKAAVMSGAVPTTTHLVINGFQSMGLAVNPAGAPLQYMVYGFEGFQEDQLRLYAIRDPLGAPALEQTLVDVAVYRTPEDPPSAGTTERIITFEARFWSCMYRNGSIWATHHVDNVRVRQRWYEIALNGWPDSGQQPSVVQWGEIDEGPTVRTYFGSIWADENDTMAMVFARSSPTDLISMGRTGRTSDMPLGETLPIETVQTNTVTYSGDRWGDYSAVVNDPAVPGQFWGVHEYYVGTWRTWIEPFSFGPPPCSDVPACADVDGNGIRDDNCLWWSCDDGTCNGQDIPFSDMGGANGACPPDGAVDANDRFHALNCFSNQTTLAIPGYLCEGSPPQAFNVDAGGEFGTCAPDGVCDGNDAFHALNTFEGNSTCSCPGGSGPAPRGAPLDSGRRRMKR